jgi:UDP-N-acetylglucosamine 3-dehydrogenase
MVLKLGIIGLGYWGKHYVRLVNNNPRTKLVALCDLNKEALKKYDYLNVETFLDSDAFFNYKNMDGVIIVTIAKTHTNLIKKAFMNNLKVFVEKPYTLSLKDCEMLNKMENNNKLMVGHTYLFNSKIDYIKDYLMENINNVKSISFEWTCYGPIRTDTTPIFDLAVHPISILYYLFPNKKVSQLSSIKSSSGHTYFVSFKFDEVLVNMNISWSSPGKTRKMIINDDNVKIIFDDVSNTEPVKILYVNNPTFNESYENMIFKDGNTILPQIKNCEPLGDQLNHWMDVCEGKYDCISNKEFSTNVVRLAEKLSI